ncbi:type-X family DNA polymerase [Flavihumibacter rivuli]|uniref:type-X family DNA polymerase n=1 Tax=Flavihumibacter rivuli TaxID=2838156 RepID=UPI001BDE8498|nr:nucleotidyltransferase domain-containing protein [Flavihumibacter rivuli]ULQ57750.1 type-X family DNA polymerase [Flavihumibacter rivuli]
MANSTTIKSPNHNKELAAIFRKMADCYRYLGPGERFRAIAYETASRTISNMSEPIDTMMDDIKQLDELKGVGESIAEKINEYLHTGSIKTFDKLRKKVPLDLLELMDVEGIGPATVRTLHDTLKVENREALSRAVAEGKLEGLKGFAQKKIDNLKKVLKVSQEKARMPLATAERIGQVMLEELRRISGVHLAYLAGSLRRKKETVGDIDIILTADRREWKRIVKQFTSLPQVERVLASGETRASVVLKDGGVQVDIRIVHDYEYGAALLYFTGSKEHNIQLRTIAKNKGWKINEYGVFDSATNKRLAGETEEEIYQLLGLQYVPPEKRLGKDELVKL